MKVLILASVPVLCSAILDCLAWVLLQPSKIAFTTPAAPDLPQLCGRHSAMWGPIGGPWPAARSQGAKRARKDVRLQSGGAKSECCYIEGMEVLHEDVDLVVVNKPAGIPVCPPSAPG